MSVTHDICCENHQGEGTALGRHQKLRELWGARQAAAQSWLLPLTSNVLSGKRLSLSVSLIYKMRIITNTYLIVLQRGLNVPIHVANTEQRGSINVSC